MSLSVSFCQATPASLTSQLSSTSSNAQLSITSRCTGRAEVGKVGAGVGGAQAGLLRDVVDLKVEVIAVVVCGSGDGEVVVVGGGDGVVVVGGGGGAGVVVLVLAASARPGEVQRPGYWEEQMSPGWHWEQAGPVTYI